MILRPSWPGNRRRRTGERKIGAKPYGAVVTIPKLKAAAIRCLRFDAWPWDVPACELRERLGCQACQYGHRVVSTVEDLFKGK